MVRSLVSAAFAVAFAAGIAMAGPAGGVEETGPSWANDADALPGDDPLEPRIVERPELVLAGVVATGSDVFQMDFHALWKRFENESPKISHKVEGAAYELHIQTEAEPTMHFTIAGYEVAKIEDLPDEVFVKVVPPATYAVFTMKFVEGFAGVYERIWAWLAESPYTGDPFAYDIQRYGRRFVSPEDPESEVDIYVPVVLEE
jgi:AraC family transcriptional regulator